ncbi:MAG: IS1634 family transposase [Candidatus Eremiobacteraeota bacterium]|nr:IS1634 family transposase [Candidatus Eremiobacteraeota bacterium]
MYIESVPNRNSPPAVLLRESYRADGKIKKRTLANLTHWPPELVEGLRTLLKGGTALAPSATTELSVLRALPHGHIAAVLGMARKLDLPRLLLGRGLQAETRSRDLALAMIVSRVIAPGSKLATVRALAPETASSSLGSTLDLGPVDEREIYAALDWLGQRQERIERALAKRHLSDGTLVLYDITSSYLEGRKCELARFGYSRDHRSDRPQIVYGLLCDREGRPIAIEVFEGDVADPATLSSQVEKLKQRFGLRRIVLVGDRGMITAARIREDLKPAGLDWITAVRAPQIKQLVETGPLQLSLFDERDLAEITAPAYPGERLIVCRNPLLATERARKREELLAATERDLSRIAAATRRRHGTLQGKAAIGLAVGAVVDRHKMAKHFALTITDDSFSFRRNLESIAAEARLDGLYVVRTSLPPEAMSAADTVHAYKSLARVERAFRALKSIDLQIRPVHHWIEHRVRAHVFLCMLAYYIEWHLRQAWSPLLFDEHDHAGAKAQRASPVAAAEPSDAALHKRASRRGDDGVPISSFRDLLRHLATLTLNLVAIPGAKPSSSTLLARSTPLQQRAFDLLAVRLAA